MHTADVQRHYERTYGRHHNRCDSEYQQLRVTSLLRVLGSSAAVSLQRRRLGSVWTGLTAAAAAAASAGRISSTLRMTVRESSAACTSPLMIAASHGVAGASCCVRQTFAVIMLTFTKGQYCVTETCSSKTWSLRL